MQTNFKVNKPTIIVTLLLLHLVFFAYTQALKIGSFYQTGIINTIAGTGVSGYSGNNGPAYDAKVSMPTDIAIDSKGNKYFVDAENNRNKYFFHSKLI